MATTVLKKGVLPPMDLKTTTASSITYGPLGLARILVGLFSDSAAIREPPSSNKTKHIRLITIAQSHYCEKARWGLDLLEEKESSPIFYTEDGHPPAFLSFATLPASNNTASASPMIVLGGSKNNQIYMVKSDVILRELCPFLYPEAVADKVIELENDLGVRLGSPVRCYAYHLFLNPTKEHYDTLAEFLCKNTSKIETTVFRAMLDKGIDSAMRRVLDINERTAAASVASIRQVYNELSILLEQNGGEYLLDTQQQKYGLTAADITLAALSAPIIRPQCMMENFSLPDDKLPPEAIQLSNELRATRAGQHVLKIYEKHRPKQESGSVIVKSCKRDRFPWKESLYFSGIVGSVGLAIHMVL